MSNPLDKDRFGRPSESADGLSVLVIVVSFGVLSLVALGSLAFALVYFYRYGNSVSPDELRRLEENQVYSELDAEEQELYFQSKDYLSSNPYFRGEMTLSQNLLVQEKAVAAWEFVKDAMLTHSDLLIVNKTELNFFRKFECSASTNLPIPMKNDVYYFECKIYNLPDPATRISVGLGVKPYPWFRLPGRHAHSVAYDSDGYRRHNQPFQFVTEPVLPQFVEGDVIGVGYRVRSGTVFFTRNGKKLSESRIGGHIKNFKIPNDGQLFPIIGANNMCSVHVNVGQMGYVFIEGNVKKWGFAPLEGSGPAPPAYNKFNSDILLERSEIDDDELSEREADFPPDFWSQPDDINNDKFSYNAYSDDNAGDERITLASFAPASPPSYAEDTPNDIIDNNDHMESHTTTNNEPV